MECVGSRMLSSGYVTLADSLSIFKPASPNAHSIFNLAILTLAVAGLIFLIVEGVLFYSVWRFRRRSDTATGEPPQVYGSMPIEVAWTAAPTMIVFFLVLVTTRTLWEVEPNPPQPAAGDHTLFVSVVGHQWWFEYVYTNYDGRKLDFITANELHIPASDASTSRPTWLTLESADVCHSFWVPRLAGKMDLIPGRTNSLVLDTKETGLHLGQCAEYCGAQHAEHADPRLCADPPEEFDQWLAEQAKPAGDDPGGPRGPRRLPGRVVRQLPSHPRHRGRRQLRTRSHAPDEPHDDRRRA